MTSPTVWIPGWSVGPTVFEDTWAALPGSHIGCDLTECTRVSQFLQMTNHVIMAQSCSVDLVGWSMGAMIALEVAQQHPSHVGRLILISGSSRFLRSGPGDDGISVRALDHMQLALHNNPSAAVENFRRGMFTQDERLAGYYRHWRSAYGGFNNSTESLNAGLEYLRSFDIDPPRIQNETYILHGGEDRICPVAGALRLGDAISSSSVTVWPDVGHVPFYTQREEFKTWINSCLFG